MHYYIDPITEKKKSLNHHNKRKGICKKRRKFNELNQLGPCIILTVYEEKQRGDKTFIAYSPKHSERRKTFIKKQVRRKTRKKLKQMESTGKGHASYRKIQELWWDII